ncbi:MAG TPA: hypothetical protein PLX67_03080 [bacterium]|jgi:hypothetical protein|nr:hypothetical protein [bacterium]HNZ51099.1 hypothetical protein [bacterium]HOF79845.1 hypothetical protein [bacterium]HOH85353.1 hypothetical protein [bacterium]HOQ91646.1 hypothetical protein [bacterium]
MHLLAPNKNNGQRLIVNSHNDRQKITELNCARRWLTAYNKINQTGYCCLKANYFQSEVDVYVYRDKEVGRPLRLQITKAKFDSLTAAIQRKKGLYSPEQKADLFLLLDFSGPISLNKLNVWQSKNLRLLSGSGFLEIWLVGSRGNVINLWPGLA